MADYSGGTWLRKGESCDWYWTISQISEEYITAVHGRGVSCPGDDDAILKFGNWTSDLNTVWFEDGNMVRYSDRITSGPPSSSYTTVVTNDYWTSGSYVNDSKRWARFWKLAENSVWGHRDTTKYMYFVIGVSNVLYSGGYAY